MAVSLVLRSISAVRSSIGIVLQALEAVSKLHLTSKGCVAIRFRMLTYYIYAPLLNRIDALPLNAIYNFETASNI
jgi:hypothetical protein